MIPEAEKAKRVLISPSASKPGLAESSNLFFRTVPSDDFEALVAADFLVSHKKAKTVLVLFQQGLYSEGLLPVFSAEVAKLGGKVADKLPIGPTDWDKAIGDALAAGKPDAIFICAYSEETLAALGVVRNAIRRIHLRDLGDRRRRRRQAGRSGRRGCIRAPVRLDVASNQEPTKSFVQRFKAANNGAAPDLPPRTATTRRWLRCMRWRAPR